MTPGWRTFPSITDNFTTIITTIQNHRQQLAQQHSYHQLSSYIWDVGLSEPKRRLKREVLTVVETDWYPMFGDSLPRAACYIGYSSAFGANMGYQWTYNIGHVCIAVCPFHFFCGHATFDPLTKIKRITQIDQCLTHTTRLLWLEIGDEGLEQSYPCVNWSKHILISPISSCIPMITGVSTCPTWTSPNKTSGI